MGIENEGNEKLRPRWLVGLLIATALFGHHDGRCLLSVRKRAFPETAPGHRGCDRLGGCAGRDQCRG